MDRIRAYLTETGRTQRALAAQLGISPSHLSEIVSGRKRPSLDVAFDIERATGGMVPVQSWGPTHPYGDELSHSASADNPNQEIPHDNS